jgi:hypothetical protein
MSEPNIPPIPEWLADRPAIGGLVVPWITPRTVDGRYLLGSVNADLARVALQRRLCGVCGRSLHDGLDRTGRMRRSSPWNATPGPRSPSRAEGSARAGSTTPRPDIHGALFVTSANSSALSPE